MTRCFGPDTAHVLLCEGAGGCSLPGVIEYTEKLRLMAPSIFPDMAERLKESAAVSLTHAEDDKELPRKNQPHLRMLEVASGHILHLRPLDKDLDDTITRAMAFVPGEAREVGC